MRFCEEKFISKLHDGLTAGISKIFLDSGLAFDTINYELLLLLEQSAIIGIALNCFLLYSVA